MDTQKRTKLDPRVVALAKKVGVKLFRRDTNRGPHWNGRTVALLVNGRLSDDDDVIHEIAHYAISERRDQINFGLGASPDDYTATPNSFSADADIEETTASALGIAMQIRLGLPWKDTADYHNWTDMDYFHALRRIVRQLRDSGWRVNREGVPYRA
jgi:hypothetical protein